MIRKLLAAVLLATLSVAANAAVSFSTAYYGFGNPAPATFNATPAAATTVLVYQDTTTAAGSSATFSADSTGAFTLDASGTNPSPNLEGQAILHKIGMTGSDTQLTASYSTCTTGCAFVHAWASVWAGVNTVSAPHWNAQVNPTTATGNLQGTAVTCASGSTLVATVTQQDGTALAAITVAGGGTQVSADGTGDSNAIWVTYSCTGASITPSFTVNVTGTNQTYDIAQWILTPPLTLGAGWLQNGSIANPTVGVTNVWLQPGNFGVVDGRTVPYWLPGAGNWSTVSYEMTGSLCTTGCTSPIVDLAGNSWTIVSGVVYENGSPAGFSANVGLMVYSGNNIYQQETVSCSWWVWNGLAWDTSSGPGVGGLPTCTPGGGGGGGGTFGIKISGSHFVSNVDGTTVIKLIGDSASGLETGMDYRFSPYQTAGVGFWSGYKAYGGYGLNVVRFPLNEASWLNYTCYDAGLGLSTGHYTANGSGGYTPDPANVYQATVRQAVADATAAGLYVILDLHWSAPNNTSGQPLCPNGQGPAADGDNSITFWAQVATAFKSNPAVMFELYNEPYMSNTYAGWVTGVDSPGPDALKLNSGGTFNPLILQSNNDGSFQTIGQNWNVASVPAMISAIRGTGATNVILASPIGFAGEIETWLATYTSSGNPDSLHQFGVAFHAYGFAKGVGYLNAILSAGYPIAITETYGFDAAFDGGSNTGGYTWAEANGVGFLCWGVVNDWGGTLNLSNSPPFNSCPTP